MPKLKEEKVNLLESAYNLCGVVIGEAQESSTEINQLRICEANNLKAIAQMLKETGHESAPEEFEKDLGELIQRVRTLHQNPQSVGKHDHWLELLKKERKV